MTAGIWSVGKRLIHRRKLVTGALASAGVAALNKSSMGQPAQSPTSIFIRESGCCGDWPLVIGAMLVPNLAAHEERIQRLRQDLDYKRILKWSSTDESRISFAAKLFDYFVSESDLRFCALFVRHDQKRFPADPIEGDARYFAKYRQLLELATDDLGPFEIITQKRDDLRDELLCKDLQRLDGTNRVDRRGKPVSDLGQLVSMLCGCVRGQAEAQNSTQKQILGRLLSSLNAKTLLEIKSEKFSIDSSDI